MPGYGLACIELRRDGDVFYTPWIVINQRELVIPQTPDLAAKSELITTAFPGYTINVIDRALRDFDNSPFVP